LHVNFNTVAKKKNTKAVIIAIFLIAAFGLYLLYPVLFSSKNKTLVISDKSITMEPQFVKEGVLAFTNAGKDTIKVVDVEIADKDPERAQGLMYRTSMSYDRAMLFVMDYERPQSFWMHNTKMSLDIIYVNSNFEIVTIYKHTQPYSDSSIPSFEKAKYVVETAAGFCDKYGIDKGNLISFARVD